MSARGALHLTILVALLHLQIQADLGFGHANVIKAYEAILTPTHLCLVSNEAGKIISVKEQQVMVLHNVIEIQHTYNVIDTVPARSMSHKYQFGLQVMECATGGSLTSYVADKWQKAQALGLFLSEDEARYFFKVSGCFIPQALYGRLEETSY